MTKWTKEQEQAIYEVGQNIIVSAGAGSGKTTVLSERVLEHVKSGINIDDMLILTFTTAAAAEMKGKIRKNLGKYPELNEQYERVDIGYITTFDAYAMSLVKRYNQVLNISDKLAIIDASIITLKQKEILTSIMDEYYKNNNAKFNKLINDFCLKDDKEIFDAIINLNNKLDNKYNKRELLSNYVNDYFNDNYVTGLINSYVELISDKIINITRQIANISTFLDDKYIQKLNDYFINLINAKDYDTIKRIALSLDRIPSLPKNSPDEAKAIKAVIKSDLDDIKDMCKYNDLKELKDSYYLTQDYVEIIIEIISKLDDLLNNYKIDNNVYEFNDIAIMAINILKNNADIREELKNKYQEILIDEYQDTNDIQDVFISLIANNNVYMVGDIKQSIYRFRNANPNLFKAKYNSYVNHDGGMKIDLMKNFRSRSNVINGINLIFNSLMDDNIGGADYIATHQMIYGNQSYENVNHEDYQMQILNYELPEDKKYRKNEIEIFTIANDIKNKINNKYRIMDKESNKERNINYGDFVVLLDRSKDFNLYKKIFEYLNIPVTIMRDQTVSDSEDIMIIKNIYNMIMIINRNNFKEDEKLLGYAFMSIARSYLFEMNDNDILKIIKERNYASTNIYEICYLLVKDLMVLNNQQLYEKIIKEFDFYNKLIKVGNVKNHLITLDSIAKIVQSTNDMGFTPIDFCNYLNDIADNDLKINLSLNKEVNDSVKIMTIHASKGLEYPICYFAGLTEQFNTKELTDKFNYSNEYGFVIPYLDVKTNNIKNNFVKLLLEKKYIQDEIAEKIRLFYVSLTRAREKMIFVTSLDENMASYKVNGVIDNETRLSYRSLADILNSMTSELKSYICNVDINNIGLTKEYNYSKFNKPTIKVMPSNIINVQEADSDVAMVIENSFAKKTHNIYTTEEKNNMKLGIEMHYLLETIDFKRPDFTDIDDYKKQIIVKFMASGILDDALKVYKEYEFIYYDNNVKEHGIIDLLLIYKDHATIVDYKLKNAHDEAYKKQLAGYKKYIEELTGLKTLTYLYSLMNAELIEI